MAFLTITNVNDCLFHRTYQLPYRTRVWPLVRIAVTTSNSIPSLSTFAIWRVAGWQRSMGRSPRLRMENGPPFIINRSSPGGDLRGGVFHKCFDIYTPLPQTSLDQGILNRYFSSWETPWHWWARVCPSDPWLGVGGWGVYSWTSTLRHGDSNTPPKTTLYIKCGTFPTCAATQKNTIRSRYVLRWCLCQDKMYVAIILTTI